jgi:hypothetical protein
MLYNLLCNFTLNLLLPCPGAGECTALEQQVAGLQSSEAALTQHKEELETKLQQLEELLASTTSTRDELQGVCLARHNADMHSMAAALERPQLAPACCCEFTRVAGTTRQCNGSFCS